MNINTLVKDCYDVLQTEGWLTAARLGDFSVNLSAALNQTQRLPGLRLSQMGEKCPCQLWHSVHTPELAEPFKPWTRNVFNYGHILEAYAVELIKAAGHEVTGEQDECILDGVPGRRDCIVDGCITDIKSVNSYGYQTLKSGDVSEDPFLRDYLDQLDGYTVASAEDPLVRVKDKAYIFGINKQLGHLVLYEHRIRKESIMARIQLCREIVGLQSPPRCTCGTITEANGNIKLDLKASYNTYKFACFPNLRCFIYSGGPIYFVKVVKRPTYKGVPLTEVDRLGNILYT